jgi:hypothetical protein
MVKHSKDIHPTDMHRKEQRKKELKRNKQQRALVISPTSESSITEIL